MTKILRVFFGNGSENRMLNTLIDRCPDDLYVGYWHYYMLHARIPAFEPKHKFELDGQLYEVPLKHAIRKAEYSRTLHY